VTGDFRSSCLSLFPLTHPQVSRASLVPPLPLAETVPSPSVQAVVLPVFLSSSSCGLFGFANCLSRRNRLCHPVSRTVAQPHDVDSGVSFPSRPILALPPRILRAILSGGDNASEEPSPPRSVTGRLSEFYHLPIAEGPSHVRLEVSLVAFIFPYPPPWYDTPLLESSNRIRRAPTSCQYGFFVSGSTSSCKIVYFLLASLRR